MRISGFELLRIISIILILTMHVTALAHISGYNSFNGYVLSFINSIGNLGVTCFILISGYFGIKRNWYKFLQLVIVTTFYSVIVYLIPVVFNKYPFNIFDFIKSILVIPLYKNWFITCYLITTLLSPYLEILINSLSKNNFKFLLISLFTCFSFLPTLFNTPYYTVLYMGGKCLNYFIFIYLIGRYISLYIKNDFPTRKIFFIFLLSILSMNALNIGLSHVLNKQVFVYSMDCSPIILLSSLSIFFYFKSFNIQSKIINNVSNNIIAVYLLDGLRIYWNDIFFHVEKYNNRQYLVLIILAEVVFCFIISIIIDKLRMLLFSRIESKIAKYIINKSKISLADFKQKIVNV